MINLKNSFLLFSLFVTLCYYTQEEQEFESDYINFQLIQPKNSYSIDFSLPVSLKNIPFKGVMQGLVRGVFSYQFNFQNGFLLGLGYQYTFFQINRFKTPQQVKGGLHIHSPFINVGWDHFFNERTGIEIRTKIGYSNFNYFSDSIQRTQGSKNILKNTTFFEPNFSFVLSASSNTAYKWTVAYSIQNMGFSLVDIGLNANAGYNPTDINKKIQFLVFGFSFTHYFKQRT